MKLAPSSIFNAQWRIGTVLRWLVFACLTPGIVGVGVLFSQEYLHRRAQLERDTIGTARAMVQSVDSRLLRALTAAKALAASGPPARHELQSFHRLAREELQATQAGLNFVLSDESGQQLVNTLREVGEPLPRHGNPANLARLFATGKPVISDLYSDGLPKQPVLSIEVPVVKDGQVIYGLAIGMLPSEFESILNAQKFPESWVAAIFDSTGTTVARTRATDLFVGRKGTTEYNERIMQSPEGVMKTVNQEGIRTVSFWSRSAETGWSVGIGIPQRLLDRELNDTMVWLGSGVLAVLALSLGLAWLAGRKIAMSVRALMAPAKAMVEGGIVDIPRLTIRESAEIAQEIRQASAMLRARTAALEAANQNLERLAHVDGLTGLQNRLSMNDAMCMEFLRSCRTRSPYAVLFIDIDLFKRINDTYGHDKGDQVLQCMAGVLQSSLRETDFVARYGGEEFLAMLPDTESEEAIAVAEKVRSHIAQHAFSIPDQVTVSIGVAMVSVHDANQEDAVRRADLALYEAKECGRNMVKSYDKSRE